MGTSFLLAVVAGAGIVPIPESVMHFPDPAAFTGVGSRQQATMVTTVLEQAGSAMRATGPGPQQLVRRWLAGDLNAAEKVAVLLGGAAFHDPALLRIYGEATRSPDARVRKAAAVGLFALIGDTPPLPSAIADTAAEWERLGTLVWSLHWATHGRTLVGIWVDSYAASLGVTRPERFTFGRSTAQCLRAIRELAEPEDLPDLIALWPLLASDGDRIHAMRTIEMITLQKLVPGSSDPHKPWGAWQTDAGLATVDSWVARMCRPVDGGEQLRLAFAANNLPAGETTPPPATWFGMLQFRYPSLAPLVIERLADLTATAVVVDRQYFDNPKNGVAQQKVAAALPISSKAQNRRERRR